MTREHSLHLYTTWESKSLECRALFQQNTFLLLIAACARNIWGKKVSAEKELLHVTVLPHPARL